MKKIFIALTLLISVVFGEAEMELLKELHKTEASTLYSSIILSGNDSKELWTSERCFGALDYLHNDLKINANNDEEVAYAIMAFMHIFDRCDIGVQDKEYKKFLEWTKRVIPEDEQDNFTGNCLGLEKERLPISKN